MICWCFMNEALQFIEHWSNRLKAKKQFQNKSLCLYKLYMGAVYIYSSGQN